jgi:hypothetical protein
MSGFRDKQRTLVNILGVPGDAGSSPSKSRGGMPKYDLTTILISDHPTQVPQNITLGLLWPKFTHKYCTERNNKNIRAMCLSIIKKIIITNDI